MTIHLQYRDVEQPPGDQPARANKIVARAAPIEAVMHPHVYRIAIALWASLLFIFWVTFWGSANALFMVVIGTVYALMFFGVPYQMSRIFPGQRTSDKSLLTFLQEPFRTRTGTLPGYEALLLVILVPLCLVAGGVFMGFIIRAARFVH